MRRALIIVCLLATGLTFGCAEPEPSILATGHVFELGSADDETGELSDCAAPARLADVELYSGSIFINLKEVAEGVPVVVNLLMENRLESSDDYAPIGEGRNFRSDQNHIEVQGYEFTFESDRAGFNTLGDGSGTVRIESSGLLPTDGGLFASVPLIYPNEVQQWRDAFAAAGGDSNAIVPTFAEIQVIGETVGGTNVESNVLTMPIDVCDGCPRMTTPSCVAGR